MNLSEQMFTTTVMIRVLNFLSASAVYDQTTDTFGDSR
jgi:hypothetical protein